MIIEESSEGISNVKDQFINNFWAIPSDWRESYKNNLKSFIESDSVLSSLLIDDVPSSPDDEIPF